MDLVVGPGSRTGWVDMEGGQDRWKEDGLRWTWIVELDVWTCIGGPGLVELEEWT